MTLNELLNALNHQGVHLSVKGGGLQCRAPAGALTPELKQGLTRYKPDLIRLLQSSSSQKNTLQRVKRDHELPLSYAQ